MNIIWLEPPNLSAGFRRLAQAYCNQKGLPVEHIQFTCLTAGHLKKVNKTTWAADENKTQQFTEQLQKLKPDFIIVNDKASLNHITGKYTSLALCRGGVYNFHGVPCLVVNELRATKSTAIGGWVLLQDLGKAKRWITGTIRNEPRFEYTVCHTLDHIREMVDIGLQSDIISIDIETTGTMVSSVQYTIAWQRDKHLPFHTWVVPIINPTKLAGCHWETAEEEIEVWNLIGKINACPAPKVFQNGSYDNTYFTVYRVPVCNVLFDTLHMWHSIWVEAPKRIDFIASIAMDSYQYWKDEGKAAEGKKEEAKAGKIPKTLAGLEHYWRYGALDTHNTLLCARFLIALLTKKNLDWAVENYKRELRHQYGPAFAMSMRNIKCNQKIHFRLVDKLQQESDQALEELRIAADDPEFNPNSPAQVKSLLYDTLKAQPYGRGKQRGSTDEKILKMLQEQHPMLEWFIDKIFEVKKPKNNVSKYGTGVVKHDRFMYKMSVAATETGRYGSKAHDLWVGTNIQNLPYIMRVMLEADDNWVLFDIDYAQSDAYFTAFESGDENFIANMLGERDTHCVHCEFFFQIPYDKLYAAHKEKQDWVSHNVTGVRSITKRIVYGANYLMKGPTLLLTMSRKPLRAAAKQLGYKDAQKWKDAKLIKLADLFLKKYFKLYPGILTWLESALAKAKQMGNRASCAFGMTRIFFGSLDDNAVQRQFASFFGQGGTAGNINKAIDRIYYEENEFGGNVMLLFQVHDSIVGQVRKSHLHLIPEIQRCMDNECTIHGRTFRVPTEADVGIGWGKRMMPYREGITYDEILKHDRKWLKENGYG